MAFCSKCGEKLRDGAKFCDSCGTAVVAEASADTGKRKEVYEGKVHKCSMCGQILESFSARCPTCGCEIRRSDSSGVVLSFAKKFENCKTDAEKINLIKGFPIPNTKEDIVELMILATTNFDADYYVAHIKKDTVEAAWLVKMQQCIVKTKMMFYVEDPVYVSVHEMYSKVETDIEDAKKKLNIKRYKWSPMRWISLIMIPVSAFLGTGSIITKAYVSMVCAVAMVAGFVLTNLMGNGIIPTKSKNWRVAMFIISLLLLIPCCAFLANGI